jgi:hypothetical protein
MRTRLIVRPGFDMDTIALYQRANSRLCALLHIGCYILLSIAIDVAPQFILKTGLGGRRALRLQLLEKDEYLFLRSWCTRT